MRAGSTAIQLIRPDGESGDLDIYVEELIDVCIEHSHVRLVELQVRDIAQYPLTVTTAITETLHPENPYWSDGRAVLGRRCAPCPCAAVPAALTFWVSLEPC